MTLCTIYRHARVCFDSQGDVLTANNFGVCMYVCMIFIFFLALTKEFHVEIFFEHSEGYMLAILQCIEPLNYPRDSIISP